LKYVCDGLEACLHAMVVIPIPLNNTPSETSNQTVV
jgi:hypothetical protein